MDKRKGPLFITRKTYNKLLEKYETANKAFVEEQNITLSVLEANSLLSNRVIPLENIIRSMASNYSNLVKQQLSMFLEVLSEENAEDIYNVLSPIDYNGRCLWKTCHELLGVTPSDVFCAEDNLGWFENMSYYDLVKWNEIGQFHNIHWQESGAYELYDGSTFDETRRKEYDDYKSKLYFGTAAKIVNEFPQILKNYIQKQETEDFIATKSSEFYENINNICLELPSICAKANEDIKSDEMDSDMNEIDFSADEEMEM